MKSRQDNFKTMKFVARVGLVAAAMAAAQSAFAVGTVTLLVNGTTAATSVPPGSSVTLQANIGAPAAAYRVAFYDNGAALSSCPQFPTATMTCSVANLAVGTHVFTNVTTYMNNANLGPAVGGTTNVSSNAVSVSTSGPNFVVLPKYQILNITYAPPGPNSSVSYQTTNMVTTTLSDTASYINASKVSASLSSSVTGTFGTPGKMNSWSASAGVTLSTSNEASQEAVSQKQLAVSVSTSLLGKTSGPALTPVGVTPAVTVNTTVDHDYDSVTLWLNPVALYYVGPNQGSNTSLVLMGFATDSTDYNVVGMETATVLMGYLNGHFPMPAGLATQLGRSWANQGQQLPPYDGVALTATDYAQILAADPYMNPAYNFNYENHYGSTVTSPDGRYTLVSAAGTSLASFPYGDNITSSTLTFGYTTVSTATNTATSKQIVGYGVSIQTGGSYNFLDTVKAAFEATLSDTRTQTWTHTTSKAVATSTAITNALTLAPPCIQPNCYSSYPLIEVYQDNLYGTFMFFPTY